MNLFDNDRQRNFYEKTNERLQRKIENDIQKEKLEEIHRIKVQFDLFEEKILIKTFFYRNK